jgi:hypothetical protein
MREVPYPYPDGRTILVCQIDKNIAQVLLSRARDYISCRPHLVGCRDDDVGSRLTLPLVVDHVIILVDCFINGLIYLFVSLIFNK